MAIRSKSALGAHEHHPISSGQPSQDPQQCSQGKKLRSRAAYKRRRRLRAAFLIGFTAVTAMGSTGCSMLSGLSKNLHRSHFLDDFMIAHRNKVLATKAWFREQDCHCNERHLDEFKAGFMAGYAEVADGGNGCTPAVAPSQYWGWRYQSADGQAAVNSWFAGFPLGVRAAEQDGVGNWGRVSQVGMQVPTSVQYATPGAALPAGSYVLDADGNPLIDGAISPGNQIDAFTPTPESLDPLDLDSPGDQLPPSPTDTLPSAKDEAFYQGGDQSNDISFAMTNANDAVTSIGTTEIDSQASVENLVPRESGVDAAKATYSLDDIGDDAIEGIFGALDDTSNLGVVSPESTASQGSNDLSNESVGSVETASADGEIPFKFE